MKKIFLFGSISLLFILSGCLGKSQNQPTFTESGIAPEEIVGRYTIEIQADQFKPAELTVNLGDTVTWKNTDTTVHKIKVTEQGAIPLNSGSSWTYKFEKPGEYEFSLTDKPELTGKIIVK